MTKIHVKLVIVLVLLIPVLTLIGCGPEEGTVSDVDAASNTPALGAVPAVPVSVPEAALSEAALPEAALPEVAQSVDVSEPEDTQPVEISRIDGVVVHGEYGHQQTVTEVEIRWSVDGKSLRMAMSAPCSGYVSVGFDPENRKEGGNYIIGYVQDGIAVVRDHVGTHGNLHDADIAVGGTENIIEFAGTEVEGWTTLEFIIPLDSGDVKDQPLVPGNKHVVLVAYQDTRDDLIPVHSRHGVAQIKL